MADPSFNFTVRVFGADTLAGTLDAVKKRAARPFTKTAAAELLQDDFQQHMDVTFSGKGRQGNKWPALSPTYAAYKNRVRPGRSLLVFDGPLKASLTGQSKDTLFQKTHQAVVMGSKVPYATYHQDGTRRMPKRPLFVLTKGVAERWADIIRDEIFKGI